MNEGPAQPAERNSEKSGVEPGHELESLLDRLKEAGDETVSVDDILKAFQHRSTAPLISIIALITLVPVVGGIPGVTLITATLILIVVGESLLSEHGGICAPFYWSPQHQGREGGERRRKGPALRA